MLGNVNVLLQYNKNILLLLSAVDYRNYSLPWNCVVVVEGIAAVDQVSQYNAWTSTVTDRNRNSGTLFYQELWISVKVGIWNNSGYTRIGIINNSHILQCPLTKTSSMSIVHINHYRFQPFPISKLIIQCCQTSITRQQPMFQMLNRKSIATRLHEFFSCRRIRRN